MLNDFTVDDFKQLARNHPEGAPMMVEVGAQSVASQDVSYYSPDLQLHGCIGFLLVA